MLYEQLELPRLGRRSRRPKLFRCELCRAFFSVVTKTREPRYCSKECWSVRAPGDRVKCRHCGEAFLNQINKVYCSRSCRNLDYRTRQSGDRSHLWKGGKTKRAQLIRSSAEYRAWRRSVFERDNFACVLCGARSAAGTRVTLNADHVKPFAEFPALAFDVSNGRTLCVPCHKGTETWGWKQRWKKKLTGKTAVKLGAAT